jgi:hypothetical protein
MLSVPFASLQDGVAVESGVGDEVGVAEGIKVRIVVGIGDRFGSGAGEAVRGMFGLVASGEGEKGTGGVV